MEFDVTASQVEVVTARFGEVGSVDVEGNLEEVVTLRPSIERGLGHAY